jgi:signal transduction histidine kinase
MVHDLRNPLTVILGALDVLKLETANRTFAYSEFLDIACQSTDQMIRMVSAILDISRLESGQIPLNQKVVSLPDSVAEIVRLQTRLAAEKQLLLEADIPSTLPSVLADPALLGRILQNLIGNAIKFTPEEGQVQVSAGLFEDQPGMLLVTVKDNGPGISAKLKNRLFQKFATGRQENSGSGLGLAFCRLAVEAHGGRIWVESEPGRGTSLLFTLPIAV